MSSPCHKRWVKLKFIDKEDSNVLAAVWDSVTLVAILFRLRLIN